MPDRRVQIDDRLDRMYNRSVRCPYCHTKILKYTATCPKCGVHKKQILEASNSRAKEIQKQKTGEKIFKTRAKPDDVSFTKMVLLLLVGIFGTHNFYVGRKIRGFIMLGCMLIGFVFFFIFPPGSPSMNDVGAIPAHPYRQQFEAAGFLFPTDFLIAGAFIMWAYDAFAIVFGFYKYPIRLGEPAKKEPKVQSGKKK